MSQRQKRVAQLRGRCGRPQKSVDRGHQGEGDQEQATQLNQQALFKRLDLSPNRLNLAPQGRLGLLQVAAQNLQLKNPMSKNKCSFLALSLLTPRFYLRQVGQIALSLERVNQGFGFYRGIERRGGG